MRFRIHIFVFILFGLNFFACQRLDLRQILAGTDEMLVIFYANKKQNIQADTIRIDGKVDMRQVLNYIEDKDMPLFKCGYEGKLIFNKQRVKLTLLEMEFNLNSDCAHLRFEHEGKVICRKLEKNAIEFLLTCQKYPKLSEGISYE